jgi:hypothetical protein
MDGVEITKKDDRVITVCRDCYDYHAGGEVTNGDKEHMRCEILECDECGKKDYGVVLRRRVEEEKEKDLSMRRGQ